MIKNATTVQQQRRKARHSRIADSASLWGASNAVSEMTALHVSNAQWRQQQRSASEAPRPRLIIREAVNAPAGEDAPPPGGLLGGLLGGPRPSGPPAAPLDIRERAAGVLERDRGEVQDNL